MNTVKIDELVLGALLVFMGWTGVTNGEMHYWQVSILYPREFGWALIALGVCIPVASFILRADQNHKN